MSLTAYLVGAAAAACALHLLWLRLRRGSFSVAGKHVLITGGSQGLGRALAELCYKKGARVTIVARTVSKLKEACDEIRALGAGANGEARIQFFDLDIATANCEKVRELLQRASQSFGRVDVLVANAGTGNAQLVVGSSLQELDALLDTQVNVNLAGSLRCAAVGAQEMAADGAGGRICLVSSACGLISMPGYAIYSATKFGHRGFLAGAYHEFLRHGVRLSVYYPGSIRTPGFQAEQEVAPAVTARIEAQCSEVASAESVAKVLLQGVEAGSREITNELLPALVVDTPTGCLPLDAAIAVVVQLARVGWDIYLNCMAKWYIEPVARGGGAGAPLLGSPKRD